MQQKTAGFMILIGGILETILAVISIIIIALYLKESSPELFSQLNLTPKDGMLALIGFYALTAVHIISAVVAFTCRKKPNKYHLILITGILLLFLTVINQGWTAGNVIQYIFSYLPGAILIGAAYALKKTQSTQS